MSRIFGRSKLTAVASFLTIGAALSIGVGTAVAADEVTVDQIVHALVPVKKPLTRGLSVGPQTEVDPAAVAACIGQSLGDLLQHPSLPIRVAALDAWLHRYRGFWGNRMDALETELRREQRGNGDRGADSGPA